MSDLWLVTDQKQVPMQAMNGAWTEGMKVSFRTASGVDGSILVPLSDYSAGLIRQLLDARAKQIDEVSAL